MTKQRRGEARESDELCCRINSSKEAKQTLERNVSLNLKEGRLPGHMMMALPGVPPIQPQVAEPGA